MNAALNLGESHVEPIEYFIHGGGMLLGSIRSVVDGWDAYDAADQHLFKVNTESAARAAIVEAALHVRKGTDPTSNLNARGHHLQQAEDV